MSEYTPDEDFAAASFAIDPSASGWVRCADGSRHPWYNPDKHEWASDDGMAQRRCIPVYAEPYSPEALQRAWEHGAQGRVGPGDVVMAAPPGGGFIVDVISHEDETAKFARVIWRAPGPERDPVADLAQAMEDVLPEEAGSSVALRRYAELLAEHGVRVVADDE